MATRARAASLLEEKQLPTDKLRHLLLQLGTNLAGPATPEQLVRIIVQTSRPERVCEYVERLFDGSGETPKKAGPVFHVGETEAKSAVEPPQEVVKPKAAEPPKRQEVAPPPPKAREVVVAPPPQEVVSSTPEAPKRRLEESLSETVASREVEERPSQMIDSYPQETADTPVAEAFVEPKGFFEISGEEIATPLAVEPASSESFVFPDDIGDSAEEEASELVSPGERRRSDYSQDGRSRTVSAVSQTSQTSQISLTGVDMPIHMTEEARRASEVGTVVEQSASQAELSEEEELQSRQEAAALSKLVMAQEDLEKVQRMQARAEETVVSEREARENRRASIDLAVELAEQERARRIEEEAQAEAEAAAEAQKARSLVAAQQELERLSQLQEIAEEQRQIKAERRRSVDLVVELAEAERQRRIVEESSQPASESEGGSERPRANSGGKKGIAHLISRWNSNEGATTPSAEVKPRKPSTTDASGTPRSPMKVPPPPPSR